MTDQMREVITYLRSSGWILRKHVKPAKIDRSNPMDEAGLDRFQFVRKDGAKYYSQTRVWFVRSFITDREGMLKTMEESYL